MKIKPKLVDYALLRLAKAKPPNPKPKIASPKQVDLSKSNSLSFYINIFGILVLIIGGLCLYQRLIDRDKDEISKQNTIKGFHQYVHENIPVTEDNLRINPLDK